MLYRHVCLFKVNKYAKMKCDQRSKQPIRAILFTDSTNKSSWSASCQPMADVIQALNLHQQGECLEITSLFYREIAKNTFCFVTLEYMLETFAGCS